MYFIVIANIYIFLNQSLGTFFHISVSTFQILCFSAAVLYHYGLQTMNKRTNSDYKSLLKITNMNSLEHRQIKQSVTIFFKCLKENGSNYISNFFKPRVTP